MRTARVFDWFVSWFVLAFLFLFGSAPYAAAAGYSTGDILVAMGNGTIQVRAADGTLKTTIVSPFFAPAKGLAFDAEGNLIVSHWWNEGGTTGNTLEKFRPDGTFISAFGSLYYCNPTGVIVDKNGNVFVGEAECDRKLVKLNSAGVVVENFQ